ncbi:snRNA-activating protein complex subunit 3-like Protein [Tribolium castaneum]|uniref:snRNA-activating protein complex subunit 3 n=2 Tax=Tribolium castaneum TaxID=7070 RepID=D6WCT9_TRICA|nr:snRNA-activating protein complex subunit 3-like Protein [Tribolium castaneum]
MGAEISYNELKHLSEECSIDQLTCEEEDTKHFPTKLPENINSSTKLPGTFITNESNHFAINKFIQEMEKQKNPSQSCIGNKRSYYPRLEFPVSPYPPDLKPGSDFVASILIYRPVEFKFFHAKNASEKLRFSHEIVVLGRNTLTELRDTIMCSSDFGLCKEVENTSADLKPLANARNIYPSGFIFIDNVFYNDFRDPNSIDYSFPIIEWAKEKQIKNLSSENMENVRIESLTPRFGYPYLYMHQGDCEHLFIFADARLLNSSDCLHSQFYPHVLKINRNINRMCFMCSVSFAKWIVVDSDRLPQHKVFMCTDCCNSYNYVNGEKLGSFKLYPYYEKHVVV